MDNLEKLGQKITLTLLASQSILSASNIMIFTVSSIIVVQLAHHNGWAGVPSTLVLVGAALGAYPMGRFMDRVGRRPGLAVGHGVGISGALIAALAVMKASLPVFLLGMLMMGFTRGVLDMGRYAAAEANPAYKRARAISLVVLGGTVGSIAGPALIKWTGLLADRVGIPTLAGPWFASAGFLTLSLLLIHLFLRPDPHLVARQLAALASDQPVAGPDRTFGEIWQDTRTKLAVGAMVFGHLVMYLLMTVTPVHMHHQQHELASISWVIMAHVFGMYGLAFGVGWLVDKWGRTPVILTGGLILMISCLMAPLSTSPTWLAFVLFLLGLGWNFCFVAGSTLLADVLRPHEKGRIQGLADTLMSITAGVGSLSSGLIFAMLGFQVMNWLGAVMACVPVILVMVLRDLDYKVALKKSMPVE